MNSLITVFPNGHTHVTTTQMETQDIDSTRKSPLGPLPVSPSQGGSYSRLVAPGISFIWFDRLFLLNEFKFKTNQHQGQAASGKEPGFEPDLSPDAKLSTSNRYIHTHTPRHGLRASTFLPVK